MRRINWIGSRRIGGVTLPELLVVVSIIALAVTIAIPVISEAVRSARVHTATDQLSVSLMAARMLAVTKQSPVEFRVAVAPENYFEYLDRNDRPRKYEMPTGVQISSSTDPITFRADGSVDGGARTTIETISGGEAGERWEIEVSILGITTVTHRRER
jgi:prepilin-type N-terminal cleavage/methylation domain-containing protein